MRALAARAIGAGAARRGARGAGAAGRLCANYLYGFKAARRAARAANTARTPQLPLALPLRRRQTPVGWREKACSVWGRG